MHLGLRLILGAAIVAGVVLRFDGLGRMPLWYDEVATAMRLSGRSEAELARFYDGRLVRSGDLVESFQRVGGANGTYGIFDVVRTVAADEPESGALYFAAARAWMQTLGEETATLRALSALASVVALGLTYLLARRLFDGDVALTATALAALSPLQLRYAQEARPYALWGAFVLAASLAAHLARSSGRPRDSSSGSGGAHDVRGTRAAWLAFGACLTAALWAQPLTLLAVPALLALGATNPDPAERIPEAGAHARAGQAATRRSRVATFRALTETRWSWLATGCALAAWLPWAWVCWTERATVHELTSWLSEPTGITGMGRGWLGGLTSLFYRPRGEGGLLGLSTSTSVALSASPLLGTSSLTSVASHLVGIALGALAMAVTTAGLLCVARHAERPTRRFVLLLTLIPWLGLAALDVAIGGRRSTVVRYLLPSWTGIALAVAFWLTRPAPAVRARHALLVVLLALGGATAWSTRTARAWWDTDVPRVLRLRSAAAAIASTPGVVVVTDAPSLGLFELAQHLPPDTRLRLGATASASAAEGEWSRLVLALPSAALLATARADARARGLSLAPLLADGESDGFWRVVATEHTQASGG